MILHTIMPLEQVMEGFNRLNHAEYHVRGGMLLECSADARGARTVRRLISSNPAHYLHTQLLSAALTPQGRLSR